MSLKLLRTTEAAELLGLSPKYLRKLRATGRGPIFIRMSSRLCLYSEDDLTAWVKSAGERSREKAKPTTLYDIIG